MKINEYLEHNILQRTKHPDSIEIKIDERSKKIQLKDNSINQLNNINININPENSELEELFAKYKLDDSGYKILIKRIPRNWTWFKLKKIVSTYGENECYLKEVKSKDEKEINYNYAIIVYKNYDSAIDITNKLPYIEFTTSNIESEYNQKMDTITNVLNQYIKEDYYLYQCSSWIIEQELYDVVILKDEELIQEIIENFKKYLKENEGKYLPSFSNRLECEFLNKNYNKEEEEEYEEEYYDGYDYQYDDNNYYSYQYKNKDCNKNYNNRNINKNNKSNNKKNLTKKSLYDRYCNVYLQNLPDNYNEEELMKLCKEFGKIISCKIDKKEKPLDSLGINKELFIIGYITFESRESAQNFINKMKELISNKFFVGDKQVTVGYNLRTKDMYYHHLSINNYNEYDDDNYKDNYDNYDNYNNYNNYDNYDYYYDDTGNDFYSFDYNYYNNYDYNNYKKGNNKGNRNKRINNRSYQNNNINNRNINKNNYNNYNNNDYEYDYEEYNEEDDYNNKNRNNNNRKNNHKINDSISRSAQIDYSENIDAPPALNDNFLIENNSSYKILNNCNKIFSNSGINNKNYNRKYVKNQMPKYKNRRNYINQP